MVRWIASYLGERRSKITMDWLTSVEHTIKAGVHQGSPLWPSLYILYNAGFIEACNLDQDTTITSYIDDAEILVCEETTSKTYEMLKLALEEPLRWAATYASKFSPDKF